MSFLDEKHKAQWLKFWKIPPDKAEEAWANKLAMHKGQFRSAEVYDDLKPYRSMQTGEYIESRSKHRDHLKRHGLIEVGNETSYVTKQKQVELNRQGAKEMLAQIVHSKL